MKFNRIDFHVMPLIYKLLGFIVIIMPLPVHAAETVDRFQWKSIYNNTYFQPVRAHLQRLVDSNAKARKNILCVIGQKQDGPYTNAYVYWPTMNKLILWEPNSDTLDDIAMSRRYLDLKNDIAKGNDVQGSSYRITRLWADTVIRACRRYGVTITVVKRRRHG